MHRVITYANDIGLLVDYSEITIGTTIGKGGFGTVNKGKWKNQDVALKRMRLPGGCGEDLADMKEIAVLRYTDNTFCCHLIRPPLWIV